jgi:hypothetical protein
MYDSARTSRASSSHNRKVVWHHLLSQSPCQCCYRDTVPCPAIARGEQGTMMIATELSRTLTSLWHKLVPCGSAIRTVFRLYIRAGPSPYKSTGPSPYKSTGPSPYKSTGSPVPMHRPGACTLSPCQPAHTSPRATLPSMRCFQKIRDRHSMPDGTLCHGQSRPILSSIPDKSRKGYGSRK